MSAGKHIDAYNKKESEEKFMSEWNILKGFLHDLEDFCDNYYEDNRSTTYKNYIDEQIMIESRKNKTCSPCSCRSSDMIKETFYANLDEIRNNFIDKYDDLSACEKALIYKYTEFVKSNC